MQSTPEQTFFSITTLFTILSSGVVTVFVTYFTNLWINNNNFKNEYYKKLIDKRLESYEQLENVNRILNMFAYSKEHNGAYFITFSNLEYWTSLNQSMFQAMMYSRWYSAETQGTLHKLSVIFAKISDEVDSSPTVETLESAASPYLTELIQLKRDLDEYSLLDFENLHNFNSFFSINKKLIDQKRDRRKQLKKQ